MPEGHSLHRLASQLVELVGHRVAATSPQGRFDPSPVDGATVTDVQAYGKHLLVALRQSQGSGFQAAGVQGAGGQVAGGQGAEGEGTQLSVHVHLGMRGKWLRFSPVTGPGLKQVRLRLARLADPVPDVAWDLIAPSTCELLEPERREALLATLGPDPLRADADAGEARRRLQAHPATVGAALMDQSVLAGVGNVYRAEILHARGIAPDRPARQVSDQEFDGLWLELQVMMSQGVQDGRIITVPAPLGGSRTDVPEELSRRVYKQATCHDCGTPVVTSTIAGRTSYACPRCQPA